jgi:D-amino-acid oxidase
LPDVGIVVNCTGLAARALTDDDSLHPVRGQVVYVAQVGLTEWLLEQSDAAALTYVVPREHDIVVGGTAEEDVYDPRPEPAVAEQILTRAGALLPQLTVAAVLGHRVGLRPARPEVRLESVPHPDGESGGVVHCYGHGGAGVTLSWGCADDVVAEVTRLSR